MGYKDGLLAFSKSQRVTADAVSAYTIDTESTYPPLKKGQPMAVVITPEAKTTAGTGINISIMHKSTTPSTDVIIMTCKVLAAQFIVGTEITIPLPQGIILDRHLALWYDVVDTSEDWTMSAYLTPYPAT